MGPGTAPIRGPSEQKVMSNKKKKEKRKVGHLPGERLAGAARLPSLCAAAQARLGGSRMRPFRLALNVLSHSQSQ